MDKSCHSGLPGHLSSGCWICDLELCTSPLWSISRGQFPLPSSTCCGRNCVVHQRRDTQPAHVDWWSTCHFWGCRDQHTRPEIVCVHGGYLAQIPTLGPLECAWLYLRCAATGRRLISIVIDSAGIKRPNHLGHTQPELFGQCIHVALQAQHGVAMYQRPSCQRRLHSGWRLR